MDDNESEEMDGNECEEMDDNGYEDSDEEECMEANGDYVDAPSSNEFGEEDSNSIAPTETFEKLLTPDTVAHILTETNRYMESNTLMSMLTIWLPIPELKLMTSFGRNSALR